MNYLFYILYAIFIHVTTHIFNNISLKKRKFILRNKFIRLNVKVFVVTPTYLFILWKSFIKHVFIAHFRTSIMLIIKNVNVTVINISLVSIFMCFLLL